MKNKINNIEKNTGIDLDVFNVKKCIRYSKRNIKKISRENKLIQERVVILENIEKNIKCSEQHNHIKNIILKCSVKLNKIYVDIKIRDRVIYCYIEGSIVGLINKYRNNYVSQYNKQIDELSWYKKWKYKFKHFKPSSNYLEDVLKIKVIQNDKVYPNKILIKIIALKSQFLYIEDNHGEDDDMKRISLQILEKPSKDVESVIKIDPKTYKILN